jgi:hypothetical protein
VLEELYLQIQDEIKGPCGGNKQLSGLLQALHKKLDAVGDRETCDDARNFTGVKGTSAVTKGIAEVTLSYNARQIIFGTGGGTGPPHVPTASDTRV